MAGQAVQAAHPGASVSMSAAGAGLRIALGIAALCVISGFFIWSAVRTWRDPEKFDATVNNLGLGSLARGCARGIAVVAAAFTSLALFVISWILGLLLGQQRVGASAAVAFFCVYLAAVPLLTVIVVFNRPKFLVVPYMRHLDRAGIKADNRRRRRRR
jgi:hypothetical protein